MDYNNFISYEEIERIIKSLPMFTNFTLQICDQATKEPLESGNFLFFDPETKKDVRRYHQTEIKNLLHKYGSSGFDGLIMEWHQGFGASILLKVFTYQERR